MCGARSEKKTRPNRSHMKECHIRGWVNAMLFAMTVKSYLVSTGFNRFP
jgi:hypothetical protein